MKKYVRIEDTKVVDSFETDGIIEEMFHPSWLWVEVTDVKDIPERGWAAAHTDGAWSFSPEPLTQHTEEYLRILVNSQRDALLAEADFLTTGMADAYLAGILSETESSLFKNFAAYKLALNKVPYQPSYPHEVDWPERPVNVIE